MGQGIAISPCFNTQQDEIPAESLGVQGWDRACSQQGSAGLAGAPAAPSLLQLSTKLLLLVFNVQEHLLQSHIRGSSPLSSSAMSIFSLEQ